MAPYIAHGVHTLYCATHGSKGAVWWWFSLFHGVRYCSCKRLGRALATGGGQRGAVAALVHVDQNTTQGGTLQSFLLS